VGASQARIYRYTKLITSLLHVEKKKLLDSPYEEFKVGSEFFFENTGDNPCTLVDTYVEFGSCSRYRMVESRVIRIANNTSGKMSCVWVMPGEVLGYVSNYILSLRQETIFSVSPSICDIPPKSVAEFRVHFRPLIENSFYGSQLECFVFFKSMRSFRLVNDDTFTPPWCLTPLVSGYSQI